jgi:hypothetical protein
VTFTFTFTFTSLGVVFSPMSTPASEGVELIEVKFLVCDTDWLFCFDFISAPIFATASVQFVTKDRCSKQTYRNC